MGCQKKQQVPDASCLINAIRSIGYTFEAAVADVIDNSISADADNIHLNCYYSDDDPYLFILDDGCGMSENELISAMNYGSRNPADSRSENDLGRFGLGMKVASLSQCYVLTVLSKKDGKIVGCQWDLDIVNKDNDWSLLIYDEESCKKFPSYDRLSSCDHGTSVIWSDFDRIKISTDKLSKVLADKISSTRDHIALTYHRFINGDARRVSFYVNDNPVSAVDPFLLNNVHTQRRPPSVVPYKGSSIDVKPYILPHFKNMTPEEVKLCDYKNTYRFQGFYVYRCKRLIIPGTWFNLKGRKEFYNLARIQIDIPNSLDGEWKIDVKKSTADLPPELKKRISQNLEDVVVKSANVHRSRGRKTTNKGFIWNKIDNGPSKPFEYKVNMDHPVIQEIYSSFNTQEDRDKFRLLVSLLERSLPYESILADFADKKVAASAGDNDYQDNLFALACTLMSSGMSVENISNLEPFSLYPEIIKRLKNE